MNCLLVSESCRPVRRIVRLFVIFAGISGMAAGQVIDPAAYGTITLHLEAGSLAQANLSAVTAWGPLTASGTGTPVYVASDARFNAKPVVKFDGTTDVMKWATANLTAQTIFAVTTVETGAVNLSGLFSTGADKLNVRRNATTNYYRSSGQSADANDFTGAGSPAGTLSVNNVASGAYTVAVPHVVMAVAGTPQVYGDFWMGSASSALGRYWKGSVAEVIIYDGVLTPDAINRVGWYLQSKYALSSNFPSPQPTISRFTATASGPVTSGVGVLSVAGAPVTLSWEAAGATLVRIDQGALADSAMATGSVTVAPLATTTYTLTATNDFGSATDSVTVTIGATPLPLAISEFVAESDGSYPDEDGAASDWIELSNPNPYAIDLQGYRLKDSAVEWVFPAGSAIEAAGYRVIFASGKNRIDPAATLHTNFSLNPGGEYLALVAPDGAPIMEWAPQYPTQRKGASGGSAPGAAAVYYTTPTPGAANGASVAGFVGDTEFSVKRGFFTAPFQTRITSTTPGATIRYTLDGSTPTESTGTVYAGPIDVSKTTTLRARAFLTDYAPTNTDTETFVFLADVLTQARSPRPAGWPASGVNGQAMTYGWNNTLKGQYTTPQLTDALTQIPSLSIVTDQANLTNATTGIYVNALQKGDAWERPASLEFIQPDGSPGFQVNMGLRIRGGYSRNDQYAKHSLRFYFRAAYGDASLKFPLHGSSGTDEFQTLDIRSEQNYHFANDSADQNTAVREIFCRDLEGALGQPTTRSRYVHVYLNGLYWGLYQTEERAQEDFGATYFGGSPDDYDVVQTSNHSAFTYELASGSIAAWQQTWALARACAASPTNANYFALLGRDANGVRVPGMPVYIDPDHLATYMLLHYYTGDGDGPLSNFLGMNQANNWRGFRNRTDDTGWRFFVHDSEHTLLAPNWVASRATNGTTSGSNRGNFTYSNSEWIHEDMATNPEYKLKIADIAQKHLFNGGAMTKEKALPLFDARAAQISQAIIADCARWGTSTTNHTLAKWQARLNSIRTSFFPSRPTTILAHLKTRGFYPKVNPPTFSQRGGQVGARFALALDAGAQTGAIHYTLDGSDPRLVGGDVSPTAQTYGSEIIIGSPLTVRTRFRSSAGVWSAIDEAYFTTFAPASAANLVIAEVHYHPAAPTPAETAALAPAVVTADDFEFIELVNTSAETIDLGPVAFTNGIAFDFAGSGFTSLSAGARVLLVKNRAAFDLRYAALNPATLPVAGAYAGKLDDGGENLTLENTSIPVGDPRRIIAQFMYGDGAPWPDAADGAGASLVLINPAAHGDIAEPSSWRSSAPAGGSPGAIDTRSFAAWKTAHGISDPLDDSDHDGLPALMEYRLGSDPAVSSSAALPVFAIQSFPDAVPPGDYLTYSVTGDLVSDDAAMSPQLSEDLGAWSSVAVILVSETNHGDGRATRVYRSASPVSSKPGQFVRLQVTMAP